jgi:putative membrane protein
MQGLRNERHAMKTDGLIHGESRFPVSMTLIIAIAMLAIGIIAVISMAFHVGPFD